jgi:hypothetical protein
LYQYQTHGPWSKSSGVSAGKIGSPYHLIGRISFMNAQCVQ